MNQMTDLSASTPLALDDDACWDAFLRRDRAMDGRFVGAVLTTGIYCKPSCAARHPRRENMIFLPDPAAARQAGFRACLRCLPDEVGRDRVAVEAAKAFIAASEIAPSLEQVAAHAGYAPHHFHRLFKRETGLTPAAYARSLRAERLKAALEEEGSVTSAIYEAGYNAPSRAYADAERHLGMSPSAWKDGGRGVTIRYVVMGSSLGPVLVAATTKGLCRVSFDEGEDDLRRRFPKAEILPGDGALSALAGQVVQLIEEPGRPVDVPMDVRGTAFQQAVWSALRAIPAGETRSYGEIAAAIGRPGAVRAAGTACGDNGLAVLVPCHRVLRGDGSLGGYAYGVERKKVLLERERGVE
ncbi:bifunctional DNA-binding transcriptional regulator/O6-methylguanine-DNA methyltransferase Ada [Sphingomonadales bacterium 56]|uniref:bifunctional DNA-binding transcriptional regulator/O6-methylguanine-DNA methyltransferase Ada n=1 Tax=unclassified Sphingobium TaxID=2611147 RepID=UPI001919E312|nr:MULTISPECIES: bifunctional DNA-binding transcriptional regulator/O6-methylguanine-DNA methyltransferase Ada [unclassified Sphingobium]MBY2928182.1 bifunctional DNA-binding transcriptional regulator/O6-methylguanine-DNA methyltransferase Ada [Sphingomonadales bacterium 56]MBY2958282.1 bifunctional DNA-binding transcriptional regulator/O6-methylguanine-DNA methyltransferase Ada [Sphingomonadales bacterium 58]